MKLRAMLICALLSTVLLMGGIASAEDAQEGRAEINQYLIEHSIESIEKNAEYARAYDQYYDEIGDMEGIHDAQIDLLDIDFSQPMHALIFTYDEFMPTRTYDGTRIRKLSESAQSFVRYYMQNQLSYLFYDMTEWPDEESLEEYGWFYFPVNPMESMITLPAEASPMNTINAYVWLFYPPGLSGMYRVCAVRFSEIESDYVRVWTEDVYSSGDAVEKLLADTQYINKLIRKDFGSLTDDSNPVFWSIDRKALGTTIDPEVEILPA